MNAKLRKIQIIAKFEPVVYSICVCVCVFI